MRSTSALTASELDPLSRVTARMFSVGLGAVSLALALVLSITGSGIAQTAQQWLNIVAILILLAAYLFLLRGADPVGDLLSAARFRLFFLGITLAALLNAASQIGSNTSVRDDWGLTCLGLALIAAAPYLTSAQILGLTGQAVAVAVGLAAVQLAGPSFDIPVGIQIVTAVTPSLAMGLGAAAYARSLLGSLQAGARKATDARVGHDAQLRHRLSETDAMGELGALRSDVVPFLERLDRTGELAPGDEVRAATLASALRRAIVERLQRGSLAASVDSYSDADSVGTRLSERQRASLRALVKAATASGQGGVGVVAVSLVLTRRGTGAFGVIEFGGDEPEALASSLAPFIRIMRMEFTYAEVRSDAGVLRLAFDFDSRRDQAALS